MRSRRSSYGRVGNYGTQGRIEYGRLGGLGIGPNYINFYNDGFWVRVRPRCQCTTSGSGTQCWSRGCYMSGCYARARI